MKPQETVSQANPTTEEIGKALSALVNTATPADRARVLRQYSKLVLTNRAIELLDSNIQRATENGDAEAVAVLEHVRSLIELARAEGLDKGLETVGAERVHEQSVARPR